MLATLARVVVTLILAVTPSKPKPMFEVCGVPSRREVASTAWWRVCSHWLSWGSRVLSEFTG